MNYVVGEDSARKLRAMMNGDMKVGRIDATGSGVVDNLEYPDPWTVRYSSSLDNGQGSDAGGWIIYLPPGCWQGAEVDTDNYDQVGNGFAAHWYKFPDNDQHLTIADNGQTDLYAFSSNGKIVIKSDDDSGIHIAELKADSSTGEKSVRQILRSVVTGGSSETSFPFKVTAKFETREGRETQYRTTVKIDLRGARVQWGDVELYLDDHIVDYNGNIYDSGWTGSPQTPNFTVDLACYLAVGVNGSSGRVSSQGAGYQKAVLCLNKSAHPSVEGVYNTDQTCCYFRIAQVIGDGYSAPNVIQYAGYCQNFFPIYPHTEGGGGGGDETEGSDYPQAFQYKRSGQTHSIVNCNFYIDGQYTTLPNYFVPVNGTIYLNGTRTQTALATTWQFSMGTTPATGDDDISIKLYDISSYKITCDYRTTFLTLEDPLKKRYLEISRNVSSATSKIALDATNSTNAKIEVSSSGKTIKLDTSDIPQGCVSGNLAVKTLKMHTEDYPAPSFESFHVIACDDIDLTKLQLADDPVIDVVETNDGELEIQHQDSGNDTTVNMDERYVKPADIVAGSNITLTRYGRSISIASTGGGGGGVTPAELEAAITAAKTEILASVQTMLDNLGTEMNVVTGISGSEFQNSDGKIQLKFQKRRVKVLSREDSEYNDYDTFSVPMTEMNVVTGSTYGTGDHNFKNQYSRLKVLCVGVGDNPRESTVFTAHEYQ